MPQAARPPFRYYGHSTVTFTLSGGEVMMIDTWVEGNPACPPELHDVERRAYLSLSETRT